jgi:DNA-binding MarR family transcriptional regulator
VYYPRVPEVLAADDRLTNVATQYIALFRGMPRSVPPPPVRDISLGQLRLLLWLQLEGAQPMGRIADVFDLTATASTGFVGRIERHGLVERRHRLDDRRVVECALTDAGRQFLDAVSGVRIETIRRALAVLDDAELTEFERLLKVILDRQERSA